MGTSDVTNGRRRLAHGRIDETNYVKGRKGAAALESVPMIDIDVDLFKLVRVVTACPECEENRVLREWSSGPVLCRVSVFNSLRSDCRCQVTSDATYSFSYSSRGTDDGWLPNPAVLNLRVPQP